MIESHRPRKTPASDVDRTTTRQAVSARSNAGPINSSVSDHLYKLRVMANQSPSALHLQNFADAISARPSPPSTQFLPQSVRASSNSRGLPQSLKSGVEELSGLNLDNVTVHYNSAKPAQLQAHAFAQGTEIHIGPGQEQQLPHEAWHVVQQAHGRVKPTGQMTPNVLINDEAALEREADLMGAKALQLRASDRATSASSRTALSPTVQFRTLYQLSACGQIVQRKIHLVAPPHGLENTLEVEQILERLHPLLRHEDLSRETLGLIVQILDEFDEDNRTFEDLADLAVAVELEVHAEEPDQQILIGDQEAEIILDPKFQQMVQAVDLPALDQQRMAADIKAQSAFMKDVYSDLAAMVKSRRRSPEDILKWFTTQTREFANNIIRATAKIFGIPKVPLSILMAGSGAREEMFPGSDLDLAAVTDAKDNNEIMAVFEFMQRIEKVLQITVSAISRRLSGANDDIGLSPDTGVYGFKMTPELLANHALTLQNTGQDATPLIDTHRGAESNLTSRFFAERRKIGNEIHGLNSLGEILREFGPPPKVAGYLNIKTQFLRMPTLALRDIAQTCGLRSTSTFNRVRELMERGILDKTLGHQVLTALNSISGIRLQCHVHYGKETDTFAATIADQRTTEDYVLTNQELAELQQAEKILTIFWKRLSAYQIKRKEKSWGPLTSSTI